MMKYSTSLILALFCTWGWLSHNGSGSEVTAEDMKRLLSRKPVRSKEKKQELLMTRAAEELLLKKGGIQTRKPSIISLNKEDPPNCYLRKSSTMKMAKSSIEHKLFLKKGIEIPKVKGVYEENRVKFAFQPHESMVLMLKCSCLMTSDYRENDDDSSTESYEIETTSQILEVGTTNIRSGSHTTTTDYTTQTEDYHTPPSSDDETAPNFISRFKNDQYTKSKSRRKLGEEVHYSPDIAQDHAQQISPERGEGIPSNVDIHSKTTEENKNSSLEEENDVKPAPTSPRSLKVRVKESFKYGLEKVFSWGRGSHKAKSPNSSPTKNEIETDPQQKSIPDVERQAFREHSEKLRGESSENEITTGIENQDNVKHSFSQVHQNSERFEQLRTKSIASRESSSRQDQSTKNDESGKNVSIDNQVSHKSIKEYKEDRNRSSGMEEKEIAEASRFEIVEEEKDRNTSASSKFIEVSQTHKAHSSREEQNDSKQESPTTETLHGNEGSTQNTNSVATQGFVTSLMGSLMGMFSGSTNTVDKKSTVDHSLSEKHETSEKNYKNESSNLAEKEKLEMSESSILVKKEEDKDHSASTKSVQGDQAYKNNSSTEEKNDSKQEVVRSIAEHRVHDAQKPEESSSTTTTTNQGIVGGFFGGLMRRLSSKTKIEEDHSESTIKSVPPKLASSEDQKISGEVGVTVETVARDQKNNSQKTEDSSQRVEGSSQMSPSNNDGTTQAEELNFITRFKNEQYAKSKSSRESDEGVHYQSSIVPETRFKNEQYAKSKSSREHDEDVHYQSSIVPDQGQQISSEREEAKLPNTEKSTTVAPTQGVIGSVFGSIGGIMGRISGKGKTEDEKSIDSSSSQENDEYQYGKVIIVPAREIRNEGIALDDKNFMVKEEIVQQDTDIITTNQTENKIEGTQQTRMDVTIIHEKEVSRNSSEMSETVIEHLVHKGQEKASDELEKMSNREETTIPQTNIFEINKSANTESFHSEQSTRFVEEHTEKIVDKSLSKGDDEKNELERQTAVFEIEIEENNNNVISSQNLHIDENKQAADENIQEEEKSIKKEKKKKEKKEGSSHSSSSSSSSSSESHSGGMSVEKPKKKGKHKSKKPQTTIEPDQVEVTTNSEQNVEVEYKNEEYNNDYKNLVELDTVKNLIEKEHEEKVDESSAEPKSEEGNGKKSEEDENKVETKILVEAENKIKGYTDSVDEKNNEYHMKNTSSGSEENYRKLKNHESDIESKKDTFGQVEERYLIQIKDGDEQTNRVRNLESTSEEDKPKSSGGVLEEMGQSSGKHEFLVLKEKEQMQTNITSHQSEKISKIEKEEKSGSSRSSDENTSGKQKSFNTSEGEENANFEDNEHRHEKTTHQVENLESKDNNNEHERREVEELGREEAQSSTHTIISIKDTESDPVKLQVHEESGEPVQQHLFRRSPSPLVPSQSLKKGRRKKTYNFATEVPSRSICSNAEEGGERFVYLSEGIWEKKSFFVYRKTRENEFHVIAYIIVDSGLI